jgi:hypothetical protein
MRVIVGVCVALAVVVGLPAVALACTSDNDCKGDRVCEAGVCVAAAAPAACTSDKECPGDQICQAQSCVAPAAVSSPAVAPALGTPFAAAPAGVQVSFAPATNASYQVTVETAGGIRQCLAPCTIAVEPGPRRVQISGAASFTQVVEVPASGGAFTVQHAPPSRKAMWWTLTLGGAGMTALGFYGYGEKNTLFAVVGLAGGGPVFIAGFMGLLYGDKGRGQNAIRPRTAAAPAPRPSLALEAWGVTPIHGGLAGGASFSF